MYRRIALAAATLGLAAGGLLMVWALLRPYQDVQRLYGAALGFAGLLIGGVQLAGAMSIPASAGQATRRRPRWPVILGVVVIAVLTARVAMAAAVAITSPDPQPGPGRVSDPQPAPDTVPRRPPP